MQLLSNMIVGLLVIVIIAAAFIYVFRPKAALELLKKISIPLLAMLVLLRLLSEQFGSAAGFVLVALFGITSVIAYWILKRRMPIKKFPVRPGGAERKPILPGTPRNEEDGGDEVDL